jgi:hypothetical protein
MKKTIILASFIFISLVLAGSYLPAQEGGSHRRVEKAKTPEKPRPDNLDETGPGQEVKTYREGGVVITVRKLKDEISGYKTFEVTADNRNAVKKTLIGKICLFDLRIKQSRCGSGECEVFMDLPAKSAETRKWQCKEKSFFSAWTFVIVKMHNF